MSLFDTLHGLIVSCQAEPDSPLAGPRFMAAFAACAARAGAVAIRARGGEDVAAIKAAVELPVIGLTKRRLDGYEVYITPGERDLAELLAAGADAVALDVTPRPRPDGASLAELIEMVHRAGLPVLADISTADEGIAAEALGADAVSTTLSGYTPYSPNLPGPDLDLVRDLAARLSCPLIAEGRYQTPELAAEAIAAGARAVVVGTAITEPIAIARRFVSTLT